MQTIALFAGLIALLASGLMAGLFYAYSISVIWGLNRADARAAIDGMQGINFAIINPLFLLVFMGMPLLGALAAILFWLAGHPAAAWCFAGSAVAYAIGTFGVTMAVNVPMNDRLAKTTLPADARAASDIWTGYADPWLRWNHFRAAAATLSLLLAGTGLYLA